MAVALALVAFVCSWAVGAAVAQPPLPVYYFERPPYYFTHDGHPTGFLLDRAVALFALAGVPARYESMPSKRIMHKLRSGEPCCSVGWFRVPEREAFARFTLPIHRDKELVALFASPKARAMYAHRNVASLLADDSLVLGVVDGFSYGRVVDNLIRTIRPRMKSLVSTQDRMVVMVAQGRFDYFFVAPEEADVLLSEADPSLGLLLLRILDGVPEGNTRHIMCSHAVPPGVVEALDAAIVALPEDF